MPLSLTVIIPALNEAGHIAATVLSVRARLPGAEIVVVDGGSRDDTRRLAGEAGAHVLVCSPGRGLQCAHGATAARGELLLFLHADTILPANAAEVLNQWSAASPLRRIATFRLSFDRAGPFLRGCAWLTRFDSVFTRFGDQGIVVRREFYRELGGFPAWPLFEDVELLRRARRRTRVWSLPAAVTTSARRFERHGVLRQQWLNTRLLVRFLLGTSPAVLATLYRENRPSSPAGLAANPPHLS